MKKLLMKKKVYLITIVVALAVVSLVTIISSQIAMGESENELERLEAQRDALVLENEKLSHDLSLDVTDDYIVRLMRKLGYYFPGEQQIIAGEETDE